MSAYCSYMELASDGVLPQPASLLLNFLNYILLQMLYFIEKKLYFSKLIYLMLQKIKVETIIFEIHLIF